MTIDIRVALTGDAEDIADVQWRASMVAYQGLLAHRLLMSLSRCRGAAYWRRALTGQRGGGEIFVAELDERIVGFIFGGPATAALHHDDHEIYAVYVLPEAQGCGIGTELVCSFPNRRADTVAWVLDADAPSKRFFERLGGTRVDRASAVYFGGKLYPDVPQVAYRWTCLEKGGAS